MNDNLKVLANRSFLEDLNNPENLASLVNKASVNRADKRKMQKALTSHAKIKAQLEANNAKKIEDRVVSKVTSDFLYTMSVVGLTLIEDYGWVEEDDNEQISDFIVKVTENMGKYANDGMNTHDIKAKLESLTGIQLDFGDVN